MLRVVTALAGACLALAACGLAVQGTIASGGDDAEAPGSDVTAPNETGGDETSTETSTPPDVVSNDAPVNDTGAGTDTGATTDAPPEAPPPDAGDDGGDDGGPDARDAGRDVATVDADAGVLYSCPQGNPTRDCSTCADHPLSCIMCSTTDSSIFAVCVPAGSSCNGSYTPTGYDFCPCAYPSAAQCLLPQQECNSYNGGVCVTCGEYMTDTFNCKGGGTCHESQSACY